MVGCVIVSPLHAHTSKTLTFIVAVKTGQSLLLGVGERNVIVKAHCLGENKRGLEDIAVRPT